MDAELKQCPACAEEILAAAKKYKHCGEIIDLRMVSGTNPSFSPSIAAVLSLVIPGAGQIYRGKLIVGLAWLFFVIMGYVAFVFPCMILHLICVFTAAK